MLTLAAALLVATAGSPERLSPLLLPDLLHVGPPKISAEPVHPEFPQACIADLCQPRVSVPGFEQKVSMSGRRTELALRYLDRIHLEPFATGAWWLVSSGLRLDWSPGQNGEAVPTGQGGGGRFQAFFRWRLDAFNRPVRPRRHRG